MSVSASNFPALVMPEKRRSPRVEVLGRLHGSVVALRMSVVVRDIGSGGFSIETSMPFPDRSVHQFRFSPADGPDVILSAESVHTLRVSPGDAAPRFLTGFAFACEDESSRQAAEALVLSLVERSAVPTAAPHVSA
jgi:hypothetical protein